MAAVTSIIARGDDTDAAHAFGHALAAWLAGLLVLDEPPDDSDETCERVLAWLRGAASNAGPMEEDKPMQTIPTNTWTKLDGYNVEAFHEHGTNINMSVVGGELVTDPADVKCLLRPTKGTMTLPWVPPLAGDWRFETGDLYVPWVGGYLTPAQTVTSTAPEFAVTMDSNGALSQSGS